MSSIRKCLSRLVIPATMVLALLGACASTPPEPVVDFKSDYDFSNIRTLAFMPSAGETSGDSVQMYLSDMQINRINRAFEHAIDMKGFKVIDDPARADILFTWHLVAQEKTDVRTYNTGPTMGVGYGRYGAYNRRVAYSCWNCGGTEVSVRQYTQGTLIVDIIDPVMVQSVWRSVIQTRLKANKESTEEERNAAAERIIARFPPN